MEVAAEVARMFAPKTKRPPLPAVRRTAGQSLREQRDRLLENRFIPIYAATAFAWITWWLELQRLSSQQPPQPRMWLMIALAGTGLCVVVCWRLFFRFRNLNRGEVGELKVAEALDDVRSLGYAPFHDLRRDGYNIDHVVVGPAGVFAIETKFRSGYGEIEFRNGEGLFVGGRKEEADALLQARRNALDVSRTLKHDCKIDTWVQPVVVFVGDWRIKNKWRNTDTRVLTVDEISRYFEQLQPELTRDEIKLIASHLERSSKC